MVRQAEENLFAAGITRPIGTLLADAGTLIPEPGELQRASCHSSPDLLIATSSPLPGVASPQDLTTHQRMERKLRTQQGKRLYEVLAKLEGSETLRGKEGMVVAPRLLTFLQAVTTGRWEAPARI